MRTTPIASLAALLALAACGCGGGAATPEQTRPRPGVRAQIPPPESIRRAGTLVYCSDLTYPPEEFVQGDRPAGSDVEIGRAVARLLGVGARFDDTGFDGIVAALQARKCDAIVSGLNHTPERAKEVDFVDYLAVGRSLMVAKGNPQGIHGLDSLAGKSVAVEVGTAGAHLLEARNERLARKMRIVSFAKDADAVAALRKGEVAAYLGDSPPVAHYVRTHPRAFQFAGRPIDPVPVGIAVRKDDRPLEAAIRKAVRRLYATGQMRRILARWHLSDFALPPR